MLDAAPARYTQDQFLFHGVPLALHTDHPAVRAVALDLLGPFAAPAAAPAPGARVCLSAQDCWAIPPEAEVLPPSSNEVINVQASYGLNGTFARLPAINFLELAPLGGAAYSLETGQALGYLREPEAYRPWVIGHLFLLTLVLEILRGRGLYWIHAAAVADRGRGALIIGQTGAGKTTTSLALVHGGFKFLTEDRAFVRAAGDAVELLAFPKHIALTAHTLELLPWLRERLPAAPATRRKQEIAPARLFPEALAAHARPGLILFPKVRPEQPARAREISPALALQRILPNSLLASQPAVSVRHFDALTRLVEASRCYDLLLGPVPAALPDLVRGLYSD